MHLFSRWVAPLPHDLICNTCCQAINLYIGAIPDIRQRLIAMFQPERGTMLQCHRMSRALIKYNNDLVQEHAEAYQDGDEPLMQLFPGINKSEGLVVSGPDANMSTHPINGGPSLQGRLPPDCPTSLVYSRNKREADMAFQENVARAFDVKSVVHLTQTTRMMFMRVIGEMAKEQVDSREGMLCWIQLREAPRYRGLTLLLRTHEDISSLGALRERVEANYLQDPPAVFGTIFQFKGLDADCGWFIGINLVPSNKSLMASNALLAAEYKLLLVGCTRAKDKLFLTQVGEMQDHRVMLFPGTTPETVRKRQRVCPQPWCQANF